MFSCNHITTPAVTATYKIKAISVGSLEIWWHKRKQSVVSPYAGVSPSGTSTPRLCSVTVSWSGCSSGLGPTRWGSATTRCVCSPPTSTAWSFATYVNNSSDVVRTCDSGVSLAWTTICVFSCCYIASVRANSCSLPSLDEMHNS